MAAGRLAHPVQWFNSLWPSDTMWWDRSRSTLILVMACSLAFTGTVLWMHPANKRRCNDVTLSLIGWAHLQNDPCIHLKAISRQALMNLIQNMCRKITLLKSLPHLIRTNELRKGCQVAGLHYHSSRHVMFINSGNLSRHAIYPSCFHRTL